jgi:hypothetical protein
VAREDFARRTARIASTAAVALGAVIANPGWATTIDFEGVASGSDAATIGTPRGAVSAADWC